MENKMTGMVNILWRIFGKSGKSEEKKVKNLITGPENVVFGKFK